MSYQNENIIRTTKDGRVYIKNSDFFKQEKVKRLVKRLKHSTIYKAIENKKQSRSEETANND